MKEETSFSERVSRYYDEMDSFYERVWGETLHCGYWPQGEDGSLAAAQDRLTSLMIEKARLGAGERLLDVGCGTGRPAIRAALETGARVLGLTISHVQLRSALRKARDAAAAERVRFLVADALRLPFAAGSFHAAWAVESLFHVPDRGSALAEVARVLRPGARLVLTDLIERRSLRNGARALLQESFAIHSFAGPEEYGPLLSRSGLVEEERIDATHDITRTWEKTIEALDAVEDELSALYGPALVPAMRERVPRIAAVYRESLSYLILVCRKPLSEPPWST